jgi:hypothetical protein
MGEATPEGNMARPDLLNSFLDQLADAFVKRVMERMNANGVTSAKGTRGRRGPSKMKGRKLDMRCRYPGCKNKSKGPRFSFLCEQHLKLGKRAVKAAIQKAEAKAS